MSIEDEVRRVNEYIQRRPWFDFEVDSLTARNLSVTGTIDESFPQEIEVLFEHVIAFSGPSTWQTDTSHRSLSILSGARAYELNLRYQVEQGFQLFQFRAEHHPEDGWPVIAAEGLKMIAGPYFVSESR